MQSGISRRDVIKKGGAAAGVALAPQAVLAQRGGRTFRALVRYGTTAKVETLTLLPIQPREVLVRTQASGVCYTIVGGLLGTRNVTSASIPNYSGMGVVEEIGPLVKRVQGRSRDRAGNAAVRAVLRMPHGRADWCQFLSTKPAHAIAAMADGTPVNEDGALGGLSEVMVVPVEYCCPVFTDLPAAELTMLGDTLGTGLAAGHNLAPIEPGSDVVVLGAGPVGLGAVQAARILGAAQVIVVEPIKVRRELALKVGATMALDPNVEGKNLVGKIQDYARARRTGGLRAGGRGTTIFLRFREGRIYDRGRGRRFVSAEAGSGTRPDGHSASAAGV